MSTKGHSGPFSRVLGLLLITAALAGCGSSDESGASARGVVMTGTASAVSPSVSGGPAAPSTSGVAPITTTGSVTLSWSAPTENTNDSALTNLAGYVIEYGTSASAMTNTISINTVGTLTYLITDLSSGTWFFTVKAVNASGIESDPSVIVSKTI